MKNNNVMGVVFANVNDDLIRELTEVRSMASVPFGGRYRMIDFSLSNLVNAGVSKVGIIPKYNYHSLMDHVGSGTYLSTHKIKNSNYHFDQIYDKTHFIPLNEYGARFLRFFTIPDWQEPLAKWFLDKE
ncbi:MAG: hypothetical protein IJO49_03480, partial [Clostridia bacterium]|nr:hypothetical protein [Clostridia bacterium]